MSDKITMTDLLNELDTQIDTISSVKEIIITTRPLQQPGKLTAVFIVPEDDPEKLKDGDYVFSHRYPVSIIPVTFFADTPETSLTDSTGGLMKIMDDIEDLLENNFLDGMLVSVECCPQTYEIPEDWLIADNIYTRGGIVRFEGRTHPYEKAKTP